MCFSAFSHWSMKIIDKQGCHTEIKARQVKWNDLAEAAGRIIPTGLKERRGHCVLFSSFGRSKYGLRRMFIGHRVNHVQLAAPHLFEFLQEGNAVKTLAAVHQKCSERNGDEGKRR